MPMLPPPHSMEPHRALDDDEDEEEAVYLNQNDVLDEFVLDEEDLPDGDDDRDGEGGEADGISSPSWLLNLRYTKQSCTVTKIVRERLFHLSERKFLEVLGSALKRQFYHCFSYFSHVYTLTLGEGDMEFQEEGGPDDSVHTFSGHKDPVYSVACSPTDKGLVATGGGDDIAFIWRVGDGESHHQLQGHTDTVASLAFSRDGQFLASGGLDGVVNVWESSTGNLKHKLEGPGKGIDWVKWHPRGHLMLAGSDDMTAWLWNADTAACMAVFSGHSGPVTCGDFTPDGKSICTGGEDGSLRIWHPRTGDSTHVVQGHPFHTLGLTCLSIKNDSSVAITGSSDTNACLVNIQTGKVVGSFTDHTTPVECVGFSYGLELAATGGGDGKLIIWDLQSLSARSTCVHEEGVWRLIWSPISQLIYTGCLDGKVRVWDGRTGNCERIFQGHKDSIQDLAISSDGTLILSGSDDNTARAFEM